MNGAEAFLKPNESALFSPRVTVRHRILNAVATSDQRFPNRDRLQPATIGQIVPTAPHAIA
jgi:hypothetical protein